METTFLTLGLFLIGLGLVLLLGDLVMASGVMFVLALGSIIVGVVFLFRYDTMIGVGALLSLVIGIPLGLMLVIRLLPNAPLSQLARRPELEEQVALPQHQQMQGLRGRTGKTLTPLRPSGMVEFDGRRVDCLTEGMMVEAGRWVRCVEVRGGTVIVREVDKPDTFDLVTTQLE